MDTGAIPYCKFFVAIAIIFGSAQPLYAQQTPEFSKGYLMHLRLNQGVESNFHQGKDGFVVGLQLSPMWGLVEGKLRVGAALGTFFADEKMGVLGGPAIAFHLKTFQAGMFGSLANVHLELSQVWGTDNRSMVGAGLYLDALNKLLLGLSAQRDYQHNLWWLQTSIGFRISKLKKTAEPFNE